jgi:hypothetical protein
MINHNSILNFSKDNENTFLKTIKTNLKSVYLLLIVFLSLSVANAHSNGEQLAELINAPEQANAPGVAGVASGSGAVNALPVGYVTSTTKFTDFLSEPNGHLDRFSPLTITTLGTTIPNPCFRIDAPAIARRIRFMGKPLVHPERAVCIPVGNDADARAKGGRYINPANPEYEYINDGNAVAEFNPPIAGATQQYNPRGFYFQIPGRSTIGATINSKEDMCKTPDLSRVTLPEGVTAEQLRNFIRPRYQDYRTRIPGKSEVPDGVCMCLVRTLERPEGTPMNCANINGEALRAMGSVSTGSQGNETLTSGTAGGGDGFIAYANAVAQNLGTLNRMAITGRRSADAAGDVVANNVTANAGAQTVSPTSTVTGVVASTNTVSSAQATIIQCINNEYTNSVACRRRSSEAKQKCRDANEGNSTNNAMGAVLGSAADMNTMMRSGTGAQGNCMQASMMAMGAREALSAMGEKCDADVNSCKESCKEDSYDRFVERCFANNGTSVESIRNRGSEDPVLVAFREKDPTIRENYDVGARVCFRELRGAQSDYSSLVSGLGNSLQASLQCACQTSSAAGPNCQAVPNINNCDTNPSLAGCDVYGPLGACVPGSVGYDAKSCSCLQNPAAAGCSGAGTTTPASLFGGNLRVAPASGGSFAGGGAGATGAGGGRAGNLDLGGSAETVQSNLSGDGANGAGGKSAGGAYGGSVSGGGAGNGNATEEAVAAGAPPESGLGGLFNQAKNAVMGALGRGSNRTTRATAKGAVNEVNMKKFKPLRGIATSEGMGSRNMDIWKMVNMCANGETCASNRNNYMMAP